MLIYTRKKPRLLRHFRKDPVLFAYHIGDLDEFFFEQSQFAGAYDGSHVLKDVALVYTGLDTATVIAFGLTDAMDGLLDDLMPLLPDRFYCHFQSDYRDKLREQYNEQPMGTHIKMKLDELKPDAGNDATIVRLRESDESELRELYDAAYPGCYFTSRILQTGKYFGCRVENKLVSVAGVHVYSPEFKVAVLGSIATHPDHRGKGIAAQATSRLVAELRSEVELICLNVKADNAAAIRCYESLGFIKTHEYEESLFSLRT